MSQAAIRRSRTPAERLGGKAYRPKTLSKVAGDLDALGPWHFEPPTDLVAVETVKDGDSLSAYAHRHYGNAKLWPEILAANADVVDDPNDIFSGQEIRIPRRPVTPADPAAPAIAPTE